MVQFLGSRSSYPSLAIVTHLEIKRLGDYSRSRVLDLLNQMEQTGNVNHILAFRPGPKRAPIGWQFMHLAASDQRFLYFRLQGMDPPDQELNRRFAHGSIPDENTPSIAEIRSSLELHRRNIWRFVDAMSSADLDAVPPRHPEAPSDMPSQPARDWLIRLAWHEAHHHGQAHLAFNIYKATHGLV